MPKTEVPGEADLPKDQPEAESPQQELERLRAENQALKAKAALPQVVYEPTTPHGLAALESSETANMTVVEVMAAIQAKRLREPVTSYLCKDGYYCRPFMPA